MVKEDDGPRRNGRGGVYVRLQEEVETVSHNRAISPVSVTYHIKTTKRNIGLDLTTVSGLNHGR